MVNEAVILLAEDSESDVILIQRAFKLAHITNRLFVVRNGAEAIAYLMGEKPYHDRKKYPLPELVLLDLYMPLKNGFEVLTWIRRHPDLHSTRVIMLTNSDRIADVNQAYKLGADSFMVKQIDFANVIELTRSLHDYWLAKPRSPNPSLPKTRYRPPAAPALNPGLTQSGPKEDKSQTSLPSSARTAGKKRPV